MMALAVILSLLMAVSCADSPMDRTELVLGTICSVRIVAGGSDAALDAAFARLRQIDRTMSANASGTAISAINDAAGISPVAVPDDARFVIARALDYARASNGAFDPTIGPIVKLWNIGMDGQRVPTPAELEAALSLVRWDAVVVDDEAGTVFLPLPGMRLDLGAIAKGYAADEVGLILAEQGVRAAVLDLGGNVMVIGTKPDGSAWRIGVQNPFDSRGTHLGVATVPGGWTVVTSGVYERFFDADDGKRYHHILSTGTGYPVSNGLVSVTILSDSSIAADGLSTTAFTLGLEAGMALVEATEGVEALFIDEQRRLYASSGAGTLFELRDRSFTQTALR